MAMLLVLAISASGSTVGMEMRKHLLQATYFKVDEAWTESQHEIRDTKPGYHDVKYGMEELYTMEEIDELDPPAKRMGWWWWAQ